MSIFYYLPNTGALDMGGGGQYPKSDLIKY